MLEISRASPPAAAARDRSLDIDRAKGLGIILVVWGHLSGAATPDVPWWFFMSIGVVYSFHMPFFMYLSGYIFFLIGAQDRFWAAPAAMTAKRFDRLIVPFLVFAMIVVVGKYVASTLGPVDDNVTSISDGLWKVLANTHDNPSISIWYLLVLFIYSIVTPLLWRLGRRTFAIVAVVSAIGWIVPFPEDFYVARIATYYLFFALGGMVAIARAQVLPMFRRWFPALLVAFALAPYFMLGSHWALLVCGAAAIPALHGLFLQRWWDGDRVILTIGRYSMAIYLLNTIAIGLTKQAYLRVLPYQGPWLFAFLAITFAAGLGAPMLIRKALNAYPRLAPVSRYLE